MPLALKIFHDEGKVGRVLVVDLDAHQGNGTAAVFRGWPWASIFDLYQEDIFPTRKEPEDVPSLQGIVVPHRKPRSDGKEELRRIAGWLSERWEGEAGELLGPDP